MNAGSDFDRSAPLTWWGTYPVYLASVLAAAQAVSMVLTALAQGIAGMSLGGNPWLSPFIFTWPAAVGSGHIWQFATYLLVNPPSFWTLIQLVLLAMFGRDVEKFLGRKQFATLYGALVLAAPLWYAAAGFFGAQAFLFGGGLANFGVFAAFVLIYPRAEIFFGVQARWIGLALVAINSLQFFAASDFAAMGALWWTCAVAAVYLKLEGAGAFSLPELAKPRAKRARKSNAPRKAEEDLHGSIDPILEKISKSGFGSLTAEERSRLDRVREALLDKESREH